MYGLDTLTFTYGLSEFGRGVGCIIGLPIAGMLYDYTHSYVLPFYLGGGVLCLSAVVGQIANLITKRQQSKE